MFKLLLTFAVSMTLMGCAPVGAVFTGTGNTQVSPRPTDCDISIYTTAPKQGFDEIGLIEFTYDRWDGHYPRSVKEAMTVARPKICSAGGNGLLIWEANGLGQYLKATVIKVAAHD